MNPFFRSTFNWLRRVLSMSAQFGRSALLLGLFTITVSGPAFAGSVTYLYDTLGRVTKATYSSGVVITYVYDAAGNRSSYVVTGAPS